MPPKKNSVQHRVTCVCHSARCCYGEYIDASGNHQKGVQVTPATKKAHELAKKRKQAQEATQSRSRIPNEDKELAAAVAQINLHGQPQVAPSSESGSDLGLSHSDEDATVQHGEPSTSAIPDQRSFSQICPAASSARDAGIPVYNCGTLDYGCPMPEMYM